MSADTPVNKRKLRLLSLLREMFQLDQPDLDFGLYRIMHAKRGQVEAFLEAEFDQLIDLTYINGAHNLPNLGRYGEVRLLEEEFHRRMWAGEEI